MSATPPQMHRPPWWRRKWVTVGEVVGLGALAVAVLGYCDAHRERTAEEAQRRAESHRPAARPPLALTGEAADDGARLLLRPLKAGQAVQTQRYLFPRAVLDREMEVSAAQPQIDRAWIEAGLRKAVAAVPGGPREGEGELPVGVATSYLEDGELRTDAAVYRLGYRITAGGLFGGARVTLQGLALEGRAPREALQGRVEASWTAGPRLR